LLDRHLQTHHHSQNENSISNPSNFSLDKDYHPSIIENYREKFLLNHDQKLAEATFLQKLNPSVFSHLHPYSKNLDLSVLHETFNKRAQSTADENQHQLSMRVKNLYSLTNEATVSKPQSEAQSNVFKSQNVPNNLIVTNDKNNNKNSGGIREKNEAQYSAAMSTAPEKSHVIHLNSKSGVSLKCAYCEARDDFKTRYFYFIPF
jgi:hypothetical protein